VTNTNTTEARMSDLRTGWRIWCNFGDESDCTNADQLAGYELAADTNANSFGDRPTCGDAKYLTASDLPALGTVYIQPEINGQTFACDANNKRVDTFGGPADFLAGFYLRSGYRVIDANGRKVTIAGE
jgi:hypothetical protein